MAVEEAIRIAPQPGPQEVFLSTIADIAIYGGAAGGGKTWGLLLEVLRNIEVPGFGAVIFRRSYPQITNEGGMWDESYKLFPHAGGVPSKGDLIWMFPKKTRCSFRHLQFDDTVLDWQGAQIPLIGFDELTHFSERQFFYMLTRNRTTCDVKPYIRATTNPDAESWVAEFIRWWIDEETGYPILERGGIIRWFVRLNEKICWGATKAEVQEKFGPLPEESIKSFTFVPASLEDNPALMKKDPGYLGNLLAQPLVERERLLKGNWKVRPAAGKIFNRSWMMKIPRREVPRGGVECRFWDFAATAKKSKGDDPDFTAGVKIRVVNGRTYIMDVIAGQWDPGEVERQFVGASWRDYFEATRENVDYEVGWEIEPGSAGKRENVRLIAALRGITAYGQRASGDKVQRLHPLAVEAEHNGLYVVEGPWTEGFISHMHHQPDLPHDDIADGASGAFGRVFGSVGIITDEEDEIGEELELFTGV